MVSSSLSIVIVNWNLKEDTLACLGSLLAAGISPEQIILVDNGSNDGSIEAIQELYQGAIHLICNPDNLGLVPASNQGFRLALELGAEWVLWLNNDTLVSDDFFLNMHTAMQNGEYALLGPMIYYHSHPGLIWHMGDQLIPGTMLTRGTAQGQVPPPDLPEVLPVDFISGCALFIRREVFESIGYLDPDLVMYGEEVDFCWRAHLAGYRLATVTSAHMWHKVSLSANRLKPQTRYYRIRNMSRFYRKYSTRWQRIIMFIFSLLRVSRILITDLLQGQPGLISPLLHGWFDGWKA